LTGNSSIVAAVLAAGLATRFGADKLLHPFAGRPLAAHIADTLAALPVAHRLAVVTTSHPERSALFVERGFAIAENDGPARGLASSLALAAEWAHRHHAEALLICLADMPNVTVDHLTRLIAASEDNDVVATEANGVRSPPAIFSRALLPQLATLTGDRGARDLIANAAVVVAPPALVQDIDTPDDVA
jgi:molybdenum cofactor cytidylyltransferase